MAKIVIVYDSKSGNTEKMAKAVEEGAKTVKGVETELYKAGTRFPISVLDKSDAIILGSPSIYGLPTTEMRGFLDAVVELKRSKKLQLEGKIGGVFGSYGYDGGYIVDRLADVLKTLGIKLVPPMVSAVDRMGLMGTRIDEESLQKCRELGKAIAEKLVKA
jgi:NAD(P)H dehydrogenase (quinone)